MCFVEILARNQLKISWWRWTSSRYFYMYSIQDSVWYQFCAIKWNCNKFLTHNRASMKRILGLGKGFERVAAKTGKITPACALISLPLQCTTGLYGLLNWAKAVYGGITAQSWLNLSVLECCSRQDVTLSLKCLSIPRETASRLLGKVIVVVEMDYIFQKTSSDVPASRSSRYCVASQHSILSPWVANIISWKCSRISLTCQDDGFPSRNDMFGASHTGQCGGLIQCKWILSNCSTV